MDLPSIPSQGVVMRKIACALLLLALAGSGCAAHSPPSPPVEDAQATLQRELAMERTHQTSIAQNDWVIQLIAAIQTQWARPPGTGNKKVTARFHLTPDGQVDSARIVQSSGNAIFDDSVIQAVHRASPLPLPRDPAVFDPNIVMCFSPHPEACAH